MMVHTCNECKHYEIDRRCAAFDHIPDVIWTGRNSHAKPLKSQRNDVVFEPFD